MKTADHLRRAVELIEKHGLYTGDDSYVGPDGSLDLCAALYQGATCVLPEVFRTDTVAATEAIKSSAWAMAAIRAVYDALGPEVTMPETDGPDEVIDRVSHWAATAPFRQAQPPTRTQVMGRLLRTAEALDPQAATAAA
ncbi:hypothetical protein HUT19_41410 (plasmid) [Streptomyces sp. NA02950]|uniref:DUF6197 family protein n=1 Tax=Streptomyces sp. NA02950 TaxID=2742137 RepID=UPI0015913D4E|nr:hypothetical protein [Streptomyces sp. NA02950]QKV98182.1 hypothetical protein HUT19_41410 [Streptomyces sp. NA02950]